MRGYAQKIRDGDKLTHTDFRTFASAAIVTAGSD